MEDSRVSMVNPLGDRMMQIMCHSCKLTDEAILPDDVRETVKKWLIQSVRLYVCSFMFADSPFKAESTGGLGDFRDGFWVNKPNLNFAISGHL